MIGALGALAFLLSCLAYWLLVVTEGAYLGPRTVRWLYDRGASTYDRVKGFDSPDRVGVDEGVQRVPSGPLGGVVPQSPRAPGVGELVDGQGEQQDREDDQRVLDDLVERGKQWISPGERTVE